MTIEKHQISFGRALGGSEFMVRTPCCDRKVKVFKNGLNGKWLTHDKQVGTLYDHGMDPELKWPMLCKSCDRVFSAADAFEPELSAASIKIPGLKS